MFISGHYAGQDLVPKIRAGEPWKKVFGPVFIYLNAAQIGDNPLWLREDAKRQVITTSFYFWLLFAHLHREPPVKSH